VITCVHPSAAALLYGMGSKMRASANGWCPSSYSKSTAASAGLAAVSLSATAEVVLASSLLLLLLLLLVLRRGVKPLGSVIRGPVRPGTSWCVCSVAAVVFVCDRRRCSTSHQNTVVDGALLTKHTVAVKCPQNAMTLFR
jgi:hypothetical protein